MPYIYKIYNDINEKLYIGKTETSIQERFSKHLWEAKNKPNLNCAIHNAINKYGKEHFYIEQIEECSSDILSEKEKYWIKYYQTYEDKDKGYNLTPGGDGVPKYDRDKIFSLWQQGYNQKKIAELVGCDRHTISRALSFLPKEETIKNKCGNRSKAVLMLDKNTLEVLKEFNSVTEATAYVTNDPNKKTGLINRVCNKMDKTAYGYKWKYK